MTDFDLGNLHLIVDRAGATPAPIGDPTGLRYDRADTADTTTKPVPAGVEGHTLTGLRAKDCGCGVLANEECDCAEFAASLTTAPVIVLPPFPLRELRERHVTAAQIDGQAA